MTDTVTTFRIVDCDTCGGVLKPDVVFFGENVPKAPRRCVVRVGRARRLLLVLGSSLTVMSGLRFVRHAAKFGVPVAIVNQGETRGDALAAMRLDVPLGPALSRLVELSESRSRLRADPSVLFTDGSGEGPESGRGAKAPPPGGDVRVHVRARSTSGSG